MQDGVLKASCCTVALQEIESFLHRSGRTGRANRAGTAVAMYTAKEGRYLNRILKETSITNCEIVSPPAPKTVMESSAKAVSLSELQYLHTSQSYGAPLGHGAFLCPFFMECRQHCTRALLH